MSSFQYTQERLEAMKKGITCTALEPDRDAEFHTWTGGMDGCCVHCLREVLDGVRYE